MVLSIKAAEAAFYFKYCKSVLAFLISSCYSGIQTERLLCGEFHALFYVAQ
jgi:hypothetical protein